MQVAPQHDENLLPESILADVEVLEEVNSSEQSRAVVFSEAAVPALETAIRKDPKLETIETSFELEAHIGSVMVRIVGYNGSQAHVMNASSLLVQLSRLYQGANLILQLDDKFFRVTSACKVCMVQKPQPPPHISKMVVVQSWRYGRCVVVNGQYLKGHPLIGEEELVMYVIVPGCVQAQRLDLLAASKDGTRAIFRVSQLLSSALKGGNTVQLRLRRGAAFAGDCPLQVDLLKGTVAQSPSARAPAENAGRGSQSSEGLRGILSSAQSQAGVRPPSEASTQSRTFGPQPAAAEAQNLQSGHSRDQGESKFSFQTRSPRQSASPADATAIGTARSSSDGRPIAQAAHQAQHREPTASPTQPGRHDLPSPEGLPQTQSRGRQPSVAAPLATEAARLSRGARSSFEVAKRSWELASQGSQGSMPGTPPPTAGRTLDGRPSGINLPHHGEVYRINQTITMLTERYQRQYSSKSSKGLTDRYPEHSPSSPALWTAESGFSVSSADLPQSPQATGPQAQQQASRGSVSGSRTYSGVANDPGQPLADDPGQPLSDTVQVMLATARSVEQAAVDARDRYPQQLQPVLDQLLQLGELLQQACQQLGAPEQLAASCEGIREAMSFICEEARHLSTNLSAALERPDFWDPSNAQQSAKLLHDTWRRTNRTLGTAVTIASALLELQTDAARPPRQLALSQGDSGHVSGQLAQLEVQDTQDTPEGTSGAPDAPGQLPSSQQLPVEMGRDDARHLINRADSRDNTFAEALDHFMRKQQEVALERLTCPVSGAVMVDPVKASNGHTYDRASCIKILDSHGSMPGRGQFRIMVDDLTMRSELFDTIPGSEEAWRQERKRLINSVAEAEGRGDWALAHSRAEHVIHMLLQTRGPEDELVAAIQGTLERAGQRLAAEREAMTVLHDTQERGMKK